MADEEAVAVDYTVMTKDQLFEELGKAYEAKDYKLMGKLSTLVAKAEAAEAKVAKDALLVQLVDLTRDVKGILTGQVRKMVDNGKLDGAEGVWFSWDFGAIEEVGINPACRLIKSGRKTAEGGGGSGSGSYVANPAKSSDLLAQVGDHVMFAENTTRTIDKVAVEMPAGMTFQQAYDYSTNGGWRNSVRMALLKEAGVI